MSSFLSRRSNESGEIQTKVRSPSCTLAVDELEGMWTSYILLPDKKESAEAGISINEGVTDRPGGALKGSYAIKTSEFVVDCPQPSSDHAGGCFEAGKGGTVEGKPLREPDSENAICKRIAGVNVNWLAEALQQRKEVQDTERTGSC